MHIIQTYNSDVKSVSSNISNLSINLQLCGASVAIVYVYGKEISPEVCSLVLICKSKSFLASLQYAGRLGVRKSIV